MKITCLIDSLGAGGAQRQLCTIAIGLKKRGHDIRFVVYRPESHFASLLHHAEIPCELLPHSSYPRRILSVRQKLRSIDQDVVMAFLEAPSFYAELAALPSRPWGLVVGERSADPAMNKGIESWMRHAHRLADAIVCNSHTNRLMLEHAYPSLASQLCTVYNTVDLTMFHTDGLAPKWVGGAQPQCARVVVAASYQENKNMINVAKALLHLKSTLGKVPILVDWYGEVQTDPTPFVNAKRFIVNAGLETSMRLHLATQDIAREYSCADAVGLFSFYEGLPNVVCEGMASGKPILLSNVCDAGNLVIEGRNGLLCNPVSPESIAASFIRLAELSASEKRRMGLESRNIAERLFSEKAVVGEYECILEQAASRQCAQRGIGWPTDVPDSALETVKRWK